MNFKGLRAFARVMELGSLHAAAESMHVSESALSRQLSLFESEVGLTLFSRERRRLVATEQGEAFYREAERLIDAIEQVPALVDEIKRGPKRRIRVVVMPRVSGLIAAPAISRFVEENPGIDVGVDVQPRRRLERWVASQQFDIGIGALPAHHAAIRTEKILQVPAVALMAPTHPLAQSKSLKIRALKNETLITMPRNTLIGSQIGRLLDEANIVPARVVEGAETMICCHLAAHGTGIAILDAMAPVVFGEKLTAIPISPSTQLDFGLFYPRDEPTSPMVDKFAEIARAQADQVARSLA